MSDSEKTKEVKEKLINDSFAYDTVYTEKTAKCKLDSFGICGSCKKFVFAESEFEVVLSSCPTLGITINSKQQIKNCNSYDKLGTLTLFDMINMAYLIDIPKEPIGFAKKGE